MLQSSSAVRLLCVILQEQLRQWEQKSRSWQSAFANQARTEQGRQRAERVEFVQRGSEGNRGDAAWKQATRRQAKEYANFCSGRDLRFVADSLKELFRLMPTLRQAFEESSNQDLQTIADSVMSKP